MTLSRLFSALVLVVGLATTAPAFAGSDYGLAGGPQVSRPGLPLDPELLPANAAPGDCVTRRMTGPGGAYRWDRIECDSRQSAVEQGWSGHDQWGYGRQTQVIGAQAVEMRGAPPVSYACDRCASAAPIPAPAPDYCDPCAAAAASQAYDDRRVEPAYPQPPVQAYQNGYQSGYQAHFQGGYDTVCIQGCGGYAQGGYAQGGYQGGGQITCPQACGGGYAQQSYAGSAYSQQSYASGYTGRSEGDRYGPGPAYAYSTDYDVSGRDEQGYLVWPGKRP